MRILWTIWLAFFLTLVGRSQTFFPTPGPVHSQEVQFDAANECYLFFDNPSGDSLHLRWRRLEVSKPEEWDIDLCDYGTCYIDIPPQGLMNVIYDSIQPYIKLIVQPGQTAGDAWLWFRVFEDGNSVNFQDVYFSLHTSGISQGNAAAIAPLRPPYPNPFAGRLTLPAHPQATSPYQIFRSDGRLQWQGPPGELDTSAWPQGLYTIHQADAVHQLIKLHP